MKQTWLFVGLSLLSVVWIDVSWYTITLCLLLCVFHIRRFQSTHVIFFMVVFSCFLKISIPVTVNQPSTKTMTIKEVKKNYAIASIPHQQVIVYGLNDVHPEDEVSVQGEFQLIDGVHNFFSFNFTQWCHRRSMYYSIQARTTNITKEGTGLRHDLFRYVDTMKDSARQSFIKEMLYGWKEEGVCYFITSSGLHLLTLSLFLKKLLSLFFKTQHVEISVFFLLVCMAWLTAFSQTMIRYATFQMVRLVFPNLEQKDRLGLSMVVVLLLFPYMAWEMAFLIPCAFQLIAIFRMVKLKKLALSAFVLFPIQFYFMKQVSLLSILLFRPLRICYAILYVIAWLSLVVPFEVNHLSLVMQMLESIVDNDVVMCYQGSLWWMILWIGSVLQYITFHKRKQAVLLFLLLCCTQMEGYLNPFAEVMMIDVGQGDCALITLPFQQKVIMIDIMGSMTKNIPKDIVYPILRAKNIKKIDLLIVTHQDYDHSGGLRELKELVPIVKVIDTKQKAENLKLDYLKILNTKFIGKDENDNSLITFFSFSHASFLFMGDAGYEAEKALLQQYPNLHADVLKAGHHGSKTSSSPIFIHQIHPQLTLLSAGRHNRYHHPHQEVLDELAKENSFPVVTAKQGAIVIEICKYFSFFKTASNEFGIIESRLGD